MTLMPVALDPLRIDQFWSRVGPMLEQSFAHGRGDDDAIALYHDLKLGHSILWIVWDDEAKQIVCAVATKITTVPRGKVCRITACSGKGVRSWMPFMSVLENYARREGCRYIRVSGRRGWRHFLTGWYSPWVVLEKELT